MGLKVLINGTREVDALEGLRTESSATRRTVSVVPVAIPLNDPDINEYDAIEIIDEYQNKNIFSGIIKKVEPLNKEVILSEKRFKLTIVGNEARLDKIFVDIQFSANTSISTILSSIFTNRISKEGITLGTIDDFSNIIIKNPVSFGSQYLGYILDKLAEISEAYWNIDENFVFNFRRNDSYDEAGYEINDETEIFDVKTTRDSINLISAVRIQGGKGTGSALLSTAPYTQGTGYNEALTISPDKRKIVLKYPISTVAYVKKYVSDVLNKTYVIGYKGIDDADPSKEIFASYNSKELELKAGMPNFDDPSATIRYVVSYVPLVDIYIRMQDDTLVEELKQARGGTGIVEELVTDNTIKTFDDALLLGQTFLIKNTKRASTISFKTYNKTSGGQKFTGAYVPDLGIDGDYIVTLSRGTLILDDENQLVFIWEVEASTIVDRGDAYQLFKTDKTIKVDLNIDAPITSVISSKENYTMQEEGTIKAGTPLLCGTFKCGTKKCGVNEEFLSISY